MIRGITDKGDIKTVGMTEDGALKVAIEGDNSTEINNPDTSPIPVKIIENEEKKETTLKSNFLTAGTTSTIINFLNNLSFTDKSNKTRTYPIPNDFSDFEKDIAITVDSIDSNVGYIYCYDSTSGAALGGANASNIMLYGAYKKYRMDGTNYILNSSSDNSSSIQNLGTVGRIIYHTSEILVAGQTYEEATGINIFNDVVGKEITSIDIANYSDTANITLTAGKLEANIGKNIAVTLPINKELKNISLVSTEADTPVQIVVKGVE